jgi:hypothetical protein
MRSADSEPRDTAFKQDIVCASCGQAEEPCQNSLYDMRPQNSFNLGSRSSGSLPAISAALMAPIEVPMIQSGSMPASCSAC